MKLILLAAAFAAAAPDVSAVKQATSIMKECAAVANDIAANKAPAGLGKARAKFANDPKSVEPQHLQFIQAMTAGQAKLDDCGKRYDAAMFDSEALLAKLANAKLSQDDGNPLVADLTAYRDAKQFLGTAIAALSKDVHVQSFMRKTLKARFLKAPEKGAKQ